MCYDINKDIRPLIPHDDSAFEYILQEIHEATPMAHQSVSYPLIDDGLSTYIRVDQHGQYIIRLLHTGPMQQCLPVHIPGVTYSALHHIIDLLDIPIRQNMHPHQELVKHAFALLFNYLNANYNYLVCLINAY
jgi:hypothetical protein